MERRFRFYHTRRGNHVVREELNALPVEARAQLARAMKRVERGEPFEHDDEYIDKDLRAVRAFCDGNTYRVLYSLQGRSDKILLALHVHQKKDRKLSPLAKRTAKKRLRDWNARGGR